MSWSLSLVIVGTFVGANILSFGAVESSPSLPAGTLPPIRCIYNILKPEKAVLSIDVFAIDSARSAVEYSFRDPNNEVIVSDIVLLTTAGRVTYHGATAVQPPPSAREQSMKFLASLNLSQECHIVASFDSLVPGAKPRADWRKIEWLNQPPG
jgi:hypothetical protein